MALRSGISPFDFWNMSIDEISDVIDAYNQNKLEDTKLQIIMKSVQARQISEFLIPTETEKNITQLWEYYPSLFKDEKRIAEKQQEVDDIIKTVASRKAFVKRYNERIEVMPNE